MLFRSLGGFLAGLTFEQSDQVDEALRWYDQSLEFTGFRSLKDPVRVLLSRGQYRSPRLNNQERDACDGRTDQQCESALHGRRLPPFGIGDAMKAAGTAAVELFFVHAGS